MKAGNWQITGDKENRWVKLQITFNDETISTAFTLESAMRLQLRIAQAVMELVDLPVMQSVLDMAIDVIKGMEEDNETRL